MRSSRIALCALVLAAAACNKRVPVTALPPAPNSSPSVAAPPASPPAPTPSPAALAIDEGDQAFSSANYARAVARYEDYLRLAVDGAYRDKALFQLGVIYALPEYPQRDLERSLARMRQVVSEHPQSSLKSAAQMILNLRNEVTRLGADKERQDQRIRQLTNELDRLKQIDSERLRRP